MATETRISTLRHARTEFNGERRYAGTMDVALSEAGVGDAQQAATVLKNAKYDVVVTSTLRRSYDTARIIVSDSIPIVKSRLCNERNFGIMEGLTWDDVQRLNPPVLMIRVGDDLHTVNPQKGEPLENVWQRAKRFRSFLLREFRGKNILVVSHGVFLQMFHGVLSGLSCIESLAEYPSNLELRCFSLCGNRRVEERVNLLAGNGDARW
jgi:broad specificity phosphatase PhoE